MKRGIRKLRLLYICLLSLFTSSLGAQLLDSAIFISTTPASVLKPISSKAKYDVQTFKINYTTTDPLGNTIAASGALMIPLNVPCDSFSIAIYNHGTILLKSDVPSRDNFEAVIAKIFSSTGAIAIAPDYLGLGDSPGLHPYVHGASEATASLDLIRAARQYLTDSLQIGLNGEVFLTGYSQGGHAAMATAKYVEENNLLSEFNIIGAGPASGPYNLSATMLPLLLSNTPYSNPGYIPYFLFAMQDVYGNIFQSYNEILDSPYDSIIPPLFDGLNTMSVVNAALPNQIRSFIQDSVLDNLEADSLSMTHPITQALLDNDNYDWAPSFPMELYYCTQDEQVDFQNSLDAEAAMQAKGSNVVAINKGSLNHGGCVLPSLTAALNFFLNLRSECSKVNIAEFDNRTFKMFPQPAGDILKLEVSEGVLLQVYDLQGELKYQSQFANTEYLDVSSWPEGMYIVIAKGARTSFRHKLMVRH